MAKYLDSNGLLYFWQKIKALFITGVSYSSSTRKITVTKNGSSSDVVTLASVATSGSYNDLSDTPAGLTVDSALSSTSENPVQNKVINTALSEKVDTVSGKGLSTNDYTTVEKTKLSGIAEGAEVNQNAWGKMNAAGYLMSATEEVDTFYFRSDSSISISEYRSGGSSAHVDGITIGLNDLSSTYVPSTSVGSADGVCPLDSSGLVDSDYLPSYVDDVIEAYPRSSATELSSSWLSLTASGSALTPETGKIYVLMADSTSYDANSQFRWGGSTYVKLSDGGVSSITNSEIDTIIAS